MSGIWDRYDGGGAGAKAQLALALERKPKEVPADRGAALLALVEDPDVNPDYISGAAWHHLWRDTDLLAGDAADVAARLETNALALALLREAPVVHHDAEAALTRVRRWLLLEDRWAAFPKLTDALRRQAVHNEGAWPFEDDERTALIDDAARAAYLPHRPGGASAGFTDAVTRAVAEQYEEWPFPHWKRINRRETSTLAAVAAKLDPGGPPLPSPAQVLIAGCGTAIRRRCSRSNTRASTTPRSTSARRASLMRKRDARRWGSTISIFAGSI